MIFPPGTILQFMYLKERLTKLNPGTFIEIGVGKGNLSSLLLRKGWTGIGYDLNPDSVQTARQTNREAVESGKYRLECADWLMSEESSKADLIISSMVIEHLDENDEEKYFQKARQGLKPDGRIVFFVPSCPDYWGSEDETSGHYRRYTFDDLQSKSKKFGCQIFHMSGLTYPLSNWIYPLSEFLVNRSEKSYKNLSMLDRTKHSGNRQVNFKDKYPWFLGLILNDIVLYPFHILQKRNARNPRSMVIYAELKPIS